MMLTELTAVPAVALPVFQFRDHLRLGTGFTDEGLEDGLLETYLRAAIAAVEAWTGKALIERVFALQVTAWQSGESQVLPVAPVARLTSLALVPPEGGETVVDPARYRLLPDTHAPRLVAAGASLPAIPSGGRAVVTFPAGFGLVWTDVPPDLAHAVLMLAACYYEYRHEARAGAQRMPYGVAALIASWRAMRLGGARGV